MSNIRALHPNSPGHEFPVTREQAQEILGEEPIGFFWNRDDALAPGVTEWILVGPTGIAYIDAKTNLVIRHHVLYDQFPS